MSLIFPCSGCGGLNRVAPERTGSSPKCGRCGRPLSTSGSPLSVDDAQLRSLVRGSPVPVLVDFYSDSCGPCRMLAPVMQELAQKHAGKLIVAKVDTQRHQQVAAELAVTGIPAVFLYRNGVVVGQAAGFRPLPEWERMIQPHLA
jgi:thioredoxin 2